MKSPDKVKEAATYVAPLVDEFLQSIKPWAQVKNYAIKNYEHDNQATQRMQELEEEAAKYKQRLRSAGIQVTPKKKELPIQDGSPEEASSSSNQGPQGGVPTKATSQLFKKLRRRIQGQSRPLLNVLPKQAQFWKMLYAISSDTKQEYDASRELRSGKHDNETVTLLYRLANHMEQPWRSKARARLKHVLKFRNASVPRFNKPLKLLFLAHTRFKTNVQKFLADLIRQHRHALVPYHLPTKTVQEMPHQALSKALWNHKRTITDLGRDWKVQTCQRQEFAKKHPRVQLHQGHVVTGLETLNLPKSHDVFNNVGAGNAKRKLKQEHSDQFQAWIKHHQFPLDQRILDELVQHIISIIPKEYIIHNEDHANAHLMIYCPNIYNQAAHNTWMDSKTFRMLDKSVQDIKDDMQNNTPAEVSKHDYGDLCE
eukprot:s1990_g7.t1